MTTISALPVATTIGTSDALIIDQAGVTKQVLFSTVVGSAISVIPTTPSLTIQSTDAGAGLGPDLILQRNSASPAASDLIGSVRFTGNDAGLVNTIYGMIYGFITSPTNAAEKGGISIQSMQNGTLKDAVQITETGAVAIGPNSPNLYDPFYNTLVIGTALAANSGASIAASSFAGLSFTNGILGATHKSVIAMDMPTGSQRFYPQAGDPPMISMFDATSIYYGRVGINTSIPAALLDVNGLINAGSFQTSDAGFTLFDNVDVTKKLQLQLSPITTGTTRTLTVPDATDTLAVLGLAQTFTGVQTFTGMGHGMGSGTTTGTINIATGATASGQTKTLNLGAFGVNGSINTITIGPAAAGATGTTTLNGPVIALGANATAFNVKGSIFFLQDDADPTKQALFNMSLLTTGTTRSYKLPDATGTTFMMLDIGPQTVTGNTTCANANNTFGNATTTGTVSLASGAMASGQTKTVNIGTGGAAGSNANVTIGSVVATSAITLNGPTTCNSYVKTQSTTVASLTAAATAGAGARSYVTDALAPTFGAAVAGGGAVGTPVYSTGAAWNVG